MSDDNLEATVEQMAGDKAAKAWRLRVAGATWEDIALHVGYANASNAYRAVKNCPALSNLFEQAIARVSGL